MKILQTAALAAVCALSTASTVSAQETLRMTIVSGHPPVFLWVQTLQDTFIPTVNEELARTGNYEIRWNEGLGGTIARVGEELEAIEAGIADLGIAWSLFDPAKLPLQNVGYYVPFSGDDPEVVAAVMEQIQRDIPQVGEQWQRYNQIYIGGGIAPDAYAMWTSFSVSEPTDLSGHRLGTPGATSNWLDGTGAVAVAGDLSVYYNNIQTGLFDGAIVFGTAAAALRLDEVAPYVTRPRFGTSFAGGITVNMDVWNTLPEEVQSAMETASAAFSVAYYEAQRQREQAAYDAMAARGATIIEFDDDQRAAWANSLPNIAGEWVSTFEEQGLPAGDVLRSFMEGLRENGAEPVRDWDAGL